MLIVYTSRGRGHSRVLESTQYNQTPQLEEEILPMSSVRTFAPRSSLVLIRSHISFSLRRFQTNPLTGELVPRFRSLMDNWLPLSQAELGLYDRVDDAQVAVSAADEKLNRFAHRASKELLTITGESRE